MAKLSSFQVDLEKQGGVWREYEVGVEFCIARWGAPRVQRFLENERRKRRSDLGQPGSERARRAGDAILRLAIAHKILTGWKNLDDDEGKPIEFSVDAALRMCENPVYEPIVDWIVFTSKDEQLYRVQSEEEDRGN